MNKIFRTVILTIGLLLIAFAVVLMGGSLASNAVVCSTPAYASQSIDAGDVEIIADSAVPLASPAGDQQAMPAHPVTRADATVVVVNLTETFVQD
jgi:hypothetical protein